MAQAAGGRWGLQPSLMSPQLPAAYSHCSIFLCRNSTSTSSDPSVSRSSKELLMSTVRPACWPSRQPSMRRLDGPGPPLLALVRVQWSETLIRTSCSTRRPTDQQMKGR